MSIDNEHLLSKEESDRLRGKTSEPVISEEDPEHPDNKPKEKKK